MTGALSSSRAWFASRRASVPIGLFHRARAVRIGRARAIWVVIAGCRGRIRHLGDAFHRDAGLRPGHRDRLRHRPDRAFASGGDGDHMLRAWRCRLSSGALGCASRRRNRRRRRCRMHYLGMSALEVAGPRDAGHRIWWWPRSCLALLFGIAALDDCQAPQDDTRHILAALLLTLAIISHHFTAMGAVEIIPDPARAISKFSLTAAGRSRWRIAVIALMVLGMSALRRSWIATSWTAYQHLAIALNNMSQGLCMYDGDGAADHLQRALHPDVWALDRAGKARLHISRILRHRVALGNLLGQPRKTIGRSAGHFARGKTMNQRGRLRSGRMIRSSTGRCQTAAGSGPTRTSPSSGSSRSSATTSSGAGKPPRDDRSRDLAIPRARRKRAQGRQRQRQTMKSTASALFGFVRAGLAARRRRGASFERGIRQRRDRRHRRRRDCRHRSARSASSSAAPPKWCASSVNEAEGDQRRRSPALPKPRRRSATWSS